MSGGSLNYLFLRIQDREYGCDEMRRLESMFRERCFFKVADALKALVEHREKADALALSLVDPLHALEWEFSGDTLRENTDAICREWETVPR